MKLINWYYIWIKNEIFIDSSIVKKKKIKIFLQWNNSEKNRKKNILN